jgi:hypothetical protein
MASVATPSDLIAVLDETVAFLDRYGVSHWAKWLERDRDLVAKGDFSGVAHLLTAFGGMGSFNDLYICKANGHAIEDTDEPQANAILNKLSSRLYDLAAELKRERNDT